MSQEEEAVPQAEPNEGEPETNLKRLLAHLREDGLAAKLLDAREADDGSGNSLRAVLDDRMKELREAYDPPPDQED